MRLPKNTLSERGNCARFVRAGPDQHGRIAHRCAPAAVRPPSPLMRGFSRSFRSLANVSQRRPLANCLACTRERALITIGNRSAFYWSTAERSADVRNGPGTHTHIHTPKKTLDGAAFGPPPASGAHRRRFGRRAHWHTVKLIITLGAHLGVRARAHARTD